MCQKNSGLEPLSCPHAAGFQTRGKRPHMQTSPMNIQCRPKSIRMYIFAKLLPSLIYLQCLVFHLYNYIMYVLLWAGFVSLLSILVVIIIIIVITKLVYIPIEVTVIVLCVYFAGSGFCFCSCFLAVSCQCWFSWLQIFVPKNPPNYLRLRICTFFKLISCVLFYPQWHKWYARLYSRLFILPFTPSHISWLLLGYNNSRRGRKNGILNTKRL